MKLTTRSSLGIFKMVPEFLQRSTDRLHLGSGGSFPTISWMIWHNTGFRSLSVSFGCLRAWGLRGALFVRFLGFFYDFRACRVGHLECAYLIPRISNFSSKFCNIDCLTLQLRNKILTLQILLGKNIVSTEFQRFLAVYFSRKLFRKTLNLKGEQWCQAEN